MSRFFAHHPTRPPGPQIKPEGAGRMPTPPVATPHSMLQLQRSIGNHGVRALLAQDMPPQVQHAPLLQRSGAGDENEEQSGGLLGKAMNFLRSIFGGEKADQPEDGAQGSQDKAKHNDVIRDTGGVEFSDVKTRKKILIDDKKVL